MYLYLAYYSQMNIFIYGLDTVLLPIAIKLVAKDDPDIFFLVYNLIEISLYSITWPARPKSNKPI